MCILREEWVWDIILWDRKREDKPDRENGEMSKGKEKTLGNFFRYTYKMPIIYITDEVYLKLAKIAYGENIKEKEVKDVRGKRNDTTTI